MLDIFLASLMLNGNVAMYGNGIVYLVEKVKQKYSRVSTSKSLATTKTKMWLVTIHHC